MSYDGSQTPAGWYPDPQVPGQQRWWDGTTWAPSGAGPTGMPPTATGSLGLPPTPQGPGFPTTPMAPSAPGSFGPPPPTYGAPPGAGYGPAAPVFRPSSMRAGGGHTYTITTFVVAAIYAALAFFAHVVILGIIPLMMGFRAVSAKEPLGVVALIVGIAAFGFGITGFVH